MKKNVLIVAAALLILCSGCAGGEDSRRVETVVWIPVNPTEAPVMQTDAQATEDIQMTEPVEQPTEEPTEAEKETEASQKTGSTGKKPSGGSSGKNQSSNKSEPKETKPAQTEPPETKPAETEPVETEPTEPAQEDTEPLETDPPATEAGNPLYDISGYSLGSLEYTIRDRINEARGEESLEALNLNGRLSAIASCRAYELSQVWSHTRPDGRHFSTVLGDYGYGAGTVTELLVYAGGSGDGVQMAEQWLSSDSHRASLLSTSYSTIGIGVYRANGYTYVCCLLVG